MLHEHPAHRARQLRWVVPIVLLLLVAVAIAFGIQYSVTGRDVGTEFFRAHKTIHNTSQLLVRGMAWAAGALVLVVAAIAAWALRTTHRIVRPVHVLHRALDDLAGGDLGVRIELHGTDEFHEVAAAANRLVDEFADTLGRMHVLVDRIRELAEGASREPGDPASRAQLAELAGELDRTIEFFRLQPRRTLRDGRS